MEETPISELFARDPLKLSQQDLDSIIAKLREQCSKFVGGNLTAGKPAKKTAAVKAGQALLDKLGDLDIGDL